MSAARSTIVTTSTMIMVSTTTAEAMNQSGMPGLTSAILLSHCQLGIELKPDIKTCSLSNLWGVWEYKVFYITLSVTHILQYVNNM